MQQLTTNTLLQGGKYKIEKVLGQGGFGITYLAKQSVSIEGPLGKMNVEIDVTIKEFFMKDLCNRNEETSMVTVPSTGSVEFVEKFRQKFLKEAHNISKLNHPNIIKVVDVFEENGTAYYVMEYIDHGSLSDLIKEKKSLSEEDTLFFTKKIADALKYIHKQNMNHLDVKPANILLRKDGDVVLIDFGLSKNYDVTGEQTTSTPIGISVGYAPIEQSRIGGVGTFSPATDIYSLGATMYKMITGDTPPEASAVLDDGLPELPSSISEVTRKTIEKAMEPRRKTRFQSIDEFLNSLDAGKTVAKDISAASEETIVLINSPKVNKSQVDTAIKPSAPKTHVQNTDNQEKVTPKFLKEGDNEATRFISAEMVINSLIDEEEVVDLGLSVKWCSHNLGATSPEQDGNYVSWVPQNYSWRDIEGDIAGTNVDPASSTTNGKWRTPTRMQFKELIDRCRWSWLKYKDVYGCKLTGPSGKSIFIPASGKVGMNGPMRKGTFGYYWTSTKGTQWGTVHYLFFNEENSDLMYEPMNVLRSIRPVCD